MFEVIESFGCVSVQNSDAAVSNCKRWQQGGVEIMCEGVQHSAGVWLVEQQRPTGPVQQQADPLGSPRHLQGLLPPRVAEGIVPVVVRQHPGLAVVPQPSLVP